ncbi:MAG: hypothetical protein ACJATI_004578, partial [Halioglobus sp.]
YMAILEFRTWYASDQIGKDLHIKKLQLDTWVTKLKAFKNDHMTGLQECYLWERLVINWL